MLSLTVVAYALPAAWAASDDTWTMEGGGWGHGVGLSQYGAQGMALDGASVEEILSHYYSGATLADLTGQLDPGHWLLTEPEPLWVGLADDQDRVTVRVVGGEASLCQAHTGSSDCSTTRTIPAGAEWTVDVTDTDTCLVTDPAAASEPEPAGCLIDVTWEPETRVEVAGGEYAHGSVRIRPAGTSVHVALSIEIEDYLRGIAEMPSSWAPAALETQAVIARTYAVRKALDRTDESGELTPDRISQCWCHVMDTIWDQNYTGWAKESEPEHGDHWVAAVTATDGQVVIHPPSGGHIISTYYSSSTGGQTESNDHVWGGNPLPYLRSVDDHWAVDPAVDNPYDRWAATFAESTLLAVLGWDALRDVELVEGPPGSVVRFTGTDDGESVEQHYWGESLRLTFDLRSPWVSGVLQPHPFDDIGDSVHAEDIAHIAAIGITKGCNPPSNDLFCPDRTVTRGEMAAFLVRALGLPAASSDRFADDAGHVFEADADRLAEAGITKGCNPPANDRFCPDQAVTRGEMAAFLVRAFHLAGDGIDFVDDEGSIFEADIIRLAGAGVTKGCNPPANDRFCPDDPVTRGQMASFLTRALQVVGG